MPFLTQYVLRYALVKRCEKNETLVQLDSVEWHRIGPNNFIKNLFARHPVVEKNAKLLTSETRTTLKQNKSDELTNKLPQ